MSDPAATAPTPQPPPPAPPPRRSGGGFFGRLIAALLVIIITTALTLFGVAAAYLQLGYTIDTPERISLAQLQIATLQADNDLLRTQVAEVSRAANDGSESLGVVEDRVAQLETERRLLDDELRSTLAENATLVADMRASRDAVQSYATVEAGRAELLRSLEQRGLRIERFLQRLSDIAEDASLDLGTLVTPTPPPAADDETRTPTPAPAGDTPTPTETPTPAQVTRTPTPTPAQVTRTPTPTPADEPTPTP
jgi:cell division protein FtsB